MKAAITISYACRSQHGKQIYIHIWQVLLQKHKNGSMANDELWHIHSMTPTDWMLAAGQLNTVCACLLACRPNST